MSSRPEGPGSARIDERNRHIAQQAGLDQDLESQVPARYDPFTVNTLGIMLALLVAGLIWILV